MNLYQKKSLCKYYTKNVENTNVLVNKLYIELREVCGGLLHIVLDDGNLDDEDLTWCIEYCNLPKNSNRIDKDICLEIAQNMLKMSMCERNLIYYGNSKFFCSGNCFDCVIEKGDEEE